MINQVGTVKTYSASTIVKTSEFISETATKSAKIAKSIFLAACAHPFAAAIILAGAIVLTGASIIIAYAIIHRKEPEGNDKIQDDKAKPKNSANNDKQDVKIPKPSTSKELPQQKNENEELNILLNNRENQKIKKRKSAYSFNIQNQKQHEKRLSDTSGVKVTFTDEM